MNANNREEFQRARRLLIRGPFLTLRPTSQHDLSRFWIQTTGGRPQMRVRVLFSGFLLSRRSSHPRHRTPFVYVGAWMLACVAGGCGSTVATSTGPSPTKCAVTLRPPEAPVNSGGATTTVAVGTQPECVWNASSSAGWITSVTPGSGQGSAQIQMQVAAN